LPRYLPVRGAGLLMPASQTAEYPSSSSGFHSSFEACLFRDADRPRLPDAGIYFLFITVGACEGADLLAKMPSMPVTQGV
jgi:hypothetical protein